MSKSQPRSKKKWVYLNAVPNSSDDNDAASSKSQPRSKKKRLDLNAVPNSSDDDDDNRAVTKKSKQRKQLDVNAVGRNEIPVPVRNVSVKETCGGRLSAETMYLDALQSTGLFFQVGEIALAVADWDEAAAYVSKDKFCVITSMDFIDEKNDRLRMLVCTCEVAVRGKQRLLALDGPVSNQIITRERNRYCIHCIIAQKLEVS